MDPITGSLSDQTRSRYGRRRPWMLGALPVVVIFNILLWHYWPSLAGNEPAQFAYYLVCFVMVTLGLTLYMIPYTALTVTISSKDIDRVRLTTARTANLIIGTDARSGRTRECARSRAGAGLCAGRVS